MTNDKDKLRVYFFTDQSVREDKNLTPISKLIFSDIAYFHFLREGKCRASNEYFAKKYGKSNGTISKAISSLVERGYIDRFVDQNKNRTIYVKRSAFKKHDADDTRVPGLANSAIQANNDKHDEAAEHLTAVYGNQNPIPDYNRFNRVNKFFNDEKSS